MEQSQGRAVTAIRAHGDHGQDKSPQLCAPVEAPCLWGCSLQRATCQVQAVPRAEPAEQDLTQM